MNNKITAIAVIGFLLIGIIISANIAFYSSTKPLEMPKDISVISSWSADKVWALYQDYDCLEIAFNENYKKTLPNLYKKCVIIKDTWLKKEGNKKYLEMYEKYKHLEENE
tara:strand:- start:4526 stop:4855 length:330 start_codon:yes stop_codon:yes gene_type:complete